MIVFGLDLQAVKLSAFKGSNMFDRRFYLRPQRFVAFELAMILTTVGDSLGSYCIDRYVRLQKAVRLYQPGATLYNKDIVAAGSLSICASTYTSTLFGILFIFLLFWPSLPESRMWSMIKHWATVFATGVVFAASLLATIVVSKHRAYLVPSRTGSAEALYAHFANPKPSYHYRNNPFAIAWVVLLWAGFFFSALSTMYVFKASRYDLDNPHVIESYGNPEEAGAKGSEPKESEHMETESSV